MKATLLACLLGIGLCSPAFSQVNGTCIVPGGDPILVGQSLTLSSGITMRCVAGPNGPALRMSGLPAGAVTPKSTSDTPKFVSINGTCLFNGIVGRSEDGTVLRCTGGHYVPLQ